MAYDEALAERVRALLGAEPELGERAMFGGLSFLLGGTVACGVLGEELVVRVGPDAHEEALARPHARPMDFYGRRVRPIPRSPASQIPICRLRA